MDPSHIDRHIRSLSLAKACVDFGARIKTVTLVSGLTRSEVHRYFFREETAISGRAPNTQEWYHRTNLIEQAEASIFASIFSVVLSYDGAPGDALVHAYNLYREKCFEKPRISFDRAFDLAGNLNGLWLHKQTNFALNHCRICNTKYLAAVGDHATDLKGCVFCKLLKRYKSDKRLRTTFPEAPPEPIRPNRNAILGAFLADAENAGKSRGF